MRKEMAGTGRRFRNIKAWQLADSLALLIYDLTRAFPKEEQYGLTSQMRRAAVSAAANIAEGSGRRSRREYLQFLSVSKGSLRELSYYLDFAKRLGYISEDRFSEVDSNCEEAARALYGLIQAIGKQQDQSPVSGLKSPV